VGDTLEGGDTRVKAIKSDSDSDEQKRSPGFSGKNRGVIPSVAAPGVTHLSDATVSSPAKDGLKLLNEPLPPPNLPRPAKNI